MENDQQTNFHIYGYTTNSHTHIHTHTKTLSKSFLSQQEKDEKKRWKWHFLFPSSEKHLSRDRREFFVSYHSTESLQHSQIVFWMFIKIKRDVWRSCTILWAVMCALLTFLCEAKFLYLLVVERANLTFTCSENFFFLIKSPQRTFSSDLLLFWAHFWRQQNSSFFLSGVSPVIDLCREVGSYWYEFQTK